MSRHQAYRNYDYENDLEEFEGNEYLEEEEGQEELGPEDKARMAESTEEVKDALGDQAGKVTIKQIQEALWYYYYDVDKSVAYLINKFIDPAPPNPAKTKAKQPAEGEFDLHLLALDDPTVTGAAEADPWSVPAGPRSGNPWEACLSSFLGLHTMESLAGISECNRPNPTPRPQPLLSSFFQDMPWLNIPRERESVFIEPPVPRGGLLGGSGAAPKMSKLQALAAARKKKGEDRKSDEKVQDTGHKLNKLSLDDRTNLPVEGRKTMTTGLNKRRKLGGESGPEVVNVGNAELAMAMDGPADTPSQPSGQPEISPEEIVPPPEPARPSAFAQTLLGSASAAPKRQLQNFPPPYMALNFTLPDAFSKPSPDDVVLEAQSQAGKKTAPVAQKKKAAKDDVTNDMKTLKVDDTPLPKSKNLNVLSEFEKSKSKKSASFVVVGHVDAGKSTLMGRLLLDLDVVDQRTVEKYRKEAESMGKSSFALAWVLDQRTEERTRGVTIDIATNRFETDTTLFTILDAPGHRDFIPNMLAGASQADFAVLVIDASIGAFEAGLKGQTREHSLLIRSMGVSRIIVAVNKLDVVSWDKERYDEICQQVSGFLSATGFQTKNISFVPVSGLRGDNLVKRSEDAAASWYRGPTLIEELENSEPLARALNKPLRMTISEVYRTPLSPLTISGRIDAGSLQTGDALLVQPSGERAYIKSLELDQENVDWAVAGQNVVIHLTNIDPIHVRVGDIVCEPANPIEIVDSFTIKVLAFDILMPMQVDVHRGRLHSAGQITELTALLDKTTGAATKKKPKIVKPGSVARVVVKMDNKVPLEAGQRVVLRSNGETVAAGLLE